MAHNRKLPLVFSKYGAPMGRRDGHPGHEPEGKVSLQRVRIDSGGYDSGGAYWGAGGPLFWATDESGDYERFLRAASREAAKAILRDEWEEIRFYR